MNSFYNIFRRGLADGTISWLGGGTDTLAYLINPSYIFDEAHELLGDIPPAARVAGPIVLDNLGVQLDGACTADPILFSVVMAPHSINAVVFVRQNATNIESSTLLYYADQGFGFRELPFNDDVWVIPDANFGGWFRP